MYNPDLVKKFIKETYNKKDTQRVITALFKRLEVIEKDYNKNLFEFSYEELVDTLRYLNCTTRNAMGEKLTHMCNYEKWASEKGITQKNLAFYNIDRKDYRKYFNLDTLRKQYIRDREELYFRCNKLANDQDKLFLVLPYEGLGSTDEILHLTKENCLVDENDDPKRILVEGESRRIIPILDERSVTILRDAKKNPDYKVSNGTTNAKSAIRYTLDTKYMIRATKGKGNATAIENISDIVFSYYSVGTKMKKIQAWTGKYNIIIDTIIDSGIFNRLFELEKIKKLETDDFKEVLLFFGKNESSNQALKENFEDYKWALEQE